MSQKFVDEYRVSPEIRAGNHHGMWRFVRSWGLPVAIIVACWRGLSELIARSRELAASGELGLRLEARRVRQVADALAHAHARGPARVLVRAGAAPLPHAGVLGAPPGFRSYASVQVGAVRERDIDDVGLLEGAMRRAASERMDVAATGVRRRAVRRARRSSSRNGAHLAAGVLAAAPASLASQAAEATAPAPRPPARQPLPARAAPAPVARAPRRDGGWTDWRWLAGEDERNTSGADALARTWPSAAVLCGALLTFVPLVRPLAEPAPWLATAGLALVVAGWLGARRS